MAALALARLAEVEIAHPTEVSETDPFRIPAHLSNDIFNARHGYMIPLSITWSRSRLTQLCQIMRTPDARVILG